jgi:hypothetical protein
MKIILSRKGFDTSAGGVPSPILPDGRMVSLPIPDPRSPVRYGDIGDDRRDIARLVSNLTGGRLRRHSRAHLDPDLVASDRARAPGWRPVFGQEGAAQGHLGHQGVGPGDVFVFFGLFQPTRWRAGRLVFDRREPRRHVIWGWLQVARVVPVADCPGDVRAWAAEHPHLHRPPAANNVLYLARPRLQGPSLHERLPGSGVFARYRPVLRLTDPSAASPSLWRLPAALAPLGLGGGLSYHREPGRWLTRGGVCRLQSVARGQEFVFGREASATAWPWVRRLIGNIA